MPKLLVFQHSPCEPLGVLDPLLRRAGFRIRYVNFGRDPHADVDVARYDGLVVLGGPMNVDETDRFPHLATEIQILRKAVERNLPILGICLGAQLLAASLGAAVRPNAVREIGWYPLEPEPAARQDRLFRHFDGSQFVFQWHAYTFDLPAGAVHLASTPTCRNQAFRFGAHAYGLQFHLEADEALIRRWLAVPGYREELEREGGRIQVARVLRETHRYAAVAVSLAARVFSQFTACILQADGGKETPRASSPHQARLGGSRRLLPV
ncbi:MAG TPA: gamma-glutamyl-gamma-aminobutyrate hydrolase family protein [Burkholderiales bacterium]|nr:gamma-glutamyl-gamma-aminobutyrate hydrolase family protein [Burkholderiales bacterium]